MIGERLSELRKDAGLTQEELGAVLNLTKHTISSYEKEKSEPNDIIKIQLARYFNISIDYLLGITSEPKPIIECEESVIRIPKKLPPEAKNELCNFIAYLKHKYLD